VDHIKKSLKYLKSDLSQKENLLKTIQNHFPHLSDASQEELLAYFQLDTLGELKVYIEALSLTSCEHNIENTMICTCKDGKGEFKVLYESEALAQAKADNSKRQPNVHLTVYPCPYGCGWHLTKG
jgi:hypothetical protein